MNQAVKASLVTAAGGVNLVVLEIVAGLQACYLQKIQVQISDANPGTFFLRKTVVAGVGGNNAACYSMNGQPIQATVSNTWVTSRPTAATGAVGWACALPGTVGALGEFDFTTPTLLNGQGRGLLIPPNTGVSLISVLATGAPYVTVLLAEA